MGYRPAPKELPQTSHGYTVDFSRWPQTDLVGSGSFKEFGELATSTVETLRIEEGGYIRSVDDSLAQYIGINPNVVGGFNGQGQFSECLCYLDATATATNYWLGPAVFIGADQQSGTTSGEHHYTLLLNDAGGGVSDWTLYRREVGFWNVLASANGEPDVAGKHFLLRLEAYVLSDNSGVRLKCWKDGKLIIETVDTNVDRLLGPSTVANHPAYGYPGVSWGNNGIGDAARWVKWMRGGDLPEASEPKPALPQLFATKTPRVNLVGRATASIASGTSLQITHGLTLQEDDVLLALVHWNSSTAISNSGGDMTLEFGEENPTAAGSYQSWFSRVCTGSDPSSFTFTNATSARANVILLQFRNVDTANIWDVAPSASTRSTVESGTSNTTPTLDVSAAGNMAIAAFFADNDGITFRGYDQSYIDEVEHGSGQGLAAVVRSYDRAGNKTGVTANSSGTGDIVSHHVALQYRTPARQLVYVKRPWTRQPPPGTRIDNSNPLAKNLTRFVTFYMGGVGYDAFNNEQPIPAASYQGVIGTLEGTASSHPLTTGSAELELVERPRYETGMQSSGFTFMSKARNKVDGALANQEFVAGMFGGGAGGNSWAWRLTVSGTPTFTIYTDGGTTNNSSAPLPTGYDARDWHTFGGIMDYPNSTCYVDYTPDSTPSDLTGLTVDDQSAGAAMHIGAGGSATSSWNGEILYCATWKRALSQAEWDSMVANPWQIFEPRKVLASILVDETTIQLTLVDILGNALTNLTGIKWAWFDSADPNTFAAPTDKGNAETTDGNGLLEITLTNTTLTAGQTGTLVLFLNSGTDYASFRITL